MKQKHLDVLVGCASNARFTKDKFIFRAGEQADHFYLIRHGRIDLELARPGQEPITILGLSDADVLGSSWLVPPYKWKFDARTTAPTRAVRLNGRSPGHRQLESSKRLRSALSSSTLSVMTAKVKTVVPS